MSSNMCPGCKKAMDSEEAKFCPECGWNLGKSLLGQEYSVAAKTIRKSLGQCYRESRLSRWLTPVQQRVRRGLLVTRMWLRETLQGLWIWIGSALTIAAIVFFVNEWSTVALVSAVSLVCLSLIWYWQRARTPNDTRGLAFFPILTALVILCAVQGIPIDFSITH